MNRLGQYIFHLRNQPIHVRRQILIFTTFGITALIIVIWVMSLSAAPRRISTKTVKETKQPFTVLKDNIIELYANASGAWNSAKGGVGQ